jgi:hypothetical protein
VLAVYSLPALGWLLEPLAPRRVEPVRVREEHGRADSRTAEAA